MTLAEFRASVANPSAATPVAISPALSALWLAARGDWDRAHEAAQGDRTPDGSWVHAYLHRQEGDTGNAGYWYSRAGKSMPATSLDEEWAAIAQELLAR